MEKISRAFEWIAGAELIIAFLLTVVGVAREARGGAGVRVAYRRRREIFGPGIFVRLEVLVAADLIRTLAVQPTIASIGVLGLIVVIRTLLGFWSAAMAQASRANWVSGRRPGRRTQRAIGREPQLTVQGLG
jgi:uncharacterized membrane protein